MEAADVAPIAFANDASLQIQEHFVLRPTAEALPCPLIHVPPPLHRSQVEWATRVPAGALPGEGSVNNNSEHDAMIRVW